MNSEGEAGNIITRLSGLFSRGESETLGRRERALLDPEWHTLSLFVGRGLQNLEINPDEIKPEDRRKALEVSAERFIKPMEGESEERTVLLQRVFAGGSWQALNNSTLEEVALENGISRPECYELYKEALNRARDEYRTMLDSEWETWEARQ